MNNDVCSFHLAHLIPPTKYDLVGNKGEIHTQGTSRFHLRPVKVSALEPSPNSNYSENAKMTRFCLLGFLGIKR